MFITLYLALPAAAIVRAAPGNGLYAPAQTAHLPGPKLRLFTGSKIMSVALRNPARKTGAGHNGTDRNPTQPAQFADSGALSRALDECRRQLVIAKQQEGDLRIRCSLLAEKVSSLEVALVKSNQFANFDQLTGLPNRRLLRDRFTQASALAKGLALLFLDIDDFKRVNDELGHDAGDKLLQQFATRLSNSIRTSDTACRYGGDEFVALLTELDRRDDAMIALQKIRAQLAPPYVIDRHSIRLTVSDGLATYPEDGRRFTDLMQMSDRSMFRKKPGDRRCAVSSVVSNIWVHGAG
jgi:diguanylate cyclase (GGDEF)-like protein